MKEDSVLEKIGAKFGSDIVELVSVNRAFTVTILEVDDTYAYVTMTGGTERMPVPLSGISINKSAFVIKPNVGSLAVITLANGMDNAPFFLAYSEIDSFSFKRGTTEFTWEITPPGRDENGDELDGETEDVITLAVGESSIRIDTDVWEFNGGTLGGLVTLQKVVDKLNALEEGYNDLVTKYNAHIHPTPAGPSSPTTSLETTVLVPTQPVDIENEKITQ